MRGVVLWTGAIISFDVEGVALVDFGGGSVHPDINQRLDKRLTTPRRRRKGHTGTSVLRPNAAASDIMNAQRYPIGVWGVEKSYRVSNLFTASEKSSTRGVVVLCCRP